MKLFCVLFSIPDSFLQSIIQFISKPFSQTVNQADQALGSYKLYFRTMSESEAETERERGGRSMCLLCPLELWLW